GAVAAVRPAFTRLAPAQPNPFHRETAIGFTLPQRSAITLAIYSANGRRVRTLASEVRAPGEYRQTWDGRDDRGALVSPGVYYARLRVGSTTQGHTLVFLR